MITSRKAAEEQSPEEGIGMLAVNVCNWIFFLNEVPEVSRLNSKSFYLTF